MVEHILAGSLDNPPLKGREGLETAGDEVRRRLSAVGGRLQEGKAPGHEGRCPGRPLRMRALVPPTEVGVTGRDAGEPRGQPSPEFLASFLTEDTLVGLWQEATRAGGPHYLTGQADRDIRRPRLRSLLASARSLGPSPAARYAARMWLTIVIDQPFIDCNKRTGALVARTLLRLTGHRESVSEAEMAEVGNTLSDVRPHEEERLCAWIERAFPLTEGPTA
jgi:hypothetical protein